MQDACHSKFPPASPDVAPEPARPMKCSVEITPGGGKARGGLIRGRRRWALARGACRGRDGPRARAVRRLARGDDRHPRSTPAAALPVLTLKMTGKVIAVGGSLESGAVRVVSTVTDKAEAANGAAPTLLRLDPGVTLRGVLQGVRQAGEQPQLRPQRPVRLCADRLLPPGQPWDELRRSSTSTPGNYVAIDLGTNGHAAQHHVHHRQVGAPGRAAQAGRRRSRRSSSASRSPAKLHDGELVKWANAGFLVHMIVGAEAPNLASREEDRRGPEGGQGQRRRGARDRLLQLGRARSRTARRSSR